MNQQSLSNFAADLEIVHQNMEILSFGDDQEDLNATAGRSNKSG